MACAYTYLAGKAVTLMATPSPGSTFSGWSGGGCGGTDTCTLVGNASVTTTASFVAGGPIAAVGSTTSTKASPPSLTLTYAGKLRDRVGQGETALAPDGALDGTFTVTLQAGSGSRTVTSVVLGHPQGRWDTRPGQGSCVLGAAAGLDSPLLHAGAGPLTMPVADGASFTLSAADFNSFYFTPGSAFTLTATFSDGSSAVASVTISAVAPPATLVLAFNGKLRDR